MENDLLLSYVIYSYFILSYLMYIFIYICLEKNGIRG